MANPFQDFLSTAVDAVKQAGKLALSMQAGLREIRYKGEKDLVTEADLACDKVVRSLLSTAHPDHNIVTEEAGPVNHGSEYTWFVDPIDGTVNYSRGFPLWGVSVGLRQGRAMVAGAIFLPALKELYTATLGGGACLNGKPIAASRVELLSQAIISHGDFNVGDTDSAREDLNRKNFLARMRTASALQRVKCLGSAVLECAFVAAGRMDAYCMVAMKPWDVAVGGLLVTEAGGGASALDGRPFSIDGPDALFSNWILHEKLLTLLRSEDPEGAGGA